MAGRKRIDDDKKRGRKSFTLTPENIAFLNNGIDKSKRSQFINDLVSKERKKQKKTLQK